MTLAASSAGHGVAAVPPWATWAVTKDPWAARTRGSPRNSSPHTSKLNVMDVRPIFSTTTVVVTCWPKYNFAR